MTVMDSSTTLLMPIWPVLLIVAGSVIMIGIIVYALIKRDTNNDKDKLVITEDKDGKGKNWKW
jgi:hypothetical protein